MKIPVGFMKEIRRKEYIENLKKRLFLNVLLILVK